mgnify:CR=1 FL=1
MARVVMSFTLDSHRDKRILHYLEGLPGGERSKAIREALSAHLGAGGLTLGDVYQAVKDLERKIGSELALTQVGTAGANIHESDEEPADVAAKLDSLGL